jgi:preprotein translocase subunit SecF
MFIVNHRKVFFTLSAALILGSFIAMFVYGLKLGIDFKGGSLLEVSYATTRPSLETTKVELDKLNLGTYVLTPSGDLSYVLKTRDVTPAEKTSVVEVFAKAKPSANADGRPTQTESGFREEKFNSIGPVVGDQLKNKAMMAIVVVIICIVLFITFAFRKVSQPVASWKYGLATIIALAHDVIIPTGVFVVWTHFHGGEIDLLFVTALLAILGYSVHDTIVVFDRVRENLRLGHGKGSFTETVGASLHLLSSLPLLHFILLEGRLPEILPSFYLLE